MSTQRRLRREKQRNHLPPINVSVINPDGSISVIPNKDYSKLIEEGSDVINIESEE